MSLTSWIWFAFNKEGIWYSYSSKLAGREIWNWVNDLIYAWQWDIIMHVWDIIMLYKNVWILQYIYIIRIFVEYSHTNLTWFYETKYYVSVAMLLLHFVKPAHKISSLVIIWYSKFNFQFLLQWLDIKGKSLLCVTC